VVRAHALTNALSIVDNVTNYVFHSRIQSVEDEEALKLAKAEQTNVAVKFEIVQVKMFLIK
jgi:hypothetical protein